MQTSRFTGITGDKRTPVLANLVLPTILLASNGLFGWAIRGTGGYGAIPGSTFAAVCLAIVWFYLSLRGTAPGETRRYNMGWVVFGIIAGIGFSGMHSWMSFQAWDKGEFPMNPYPPIYVAPWIGYVWYLIAATPWTGLGALLASWGCSLHSYTARDWILRCALGAAGVFGALGFCAAFPQVVLPDYQLGIYSDLSSCSGCRHAIGDVELSMGFMGAFLGLLAFEIIKKDWKNVAFPLVVGLTTALSWMFFQAIDIQQYAWRAFEAMAGVGIGAGFGLSFCLFNRPEKLLADAKKVHRNAESFVGVYFALIFGLCYAAYQIVVTRLTGSDSEIVPWLVATIIGGGIAILAIVVILGRARQRRPLPDGDFVRRKDFTRLLIVSYVIMRAFGFIVTLTDGSSLQLQLVSAGVYALLIGVDAACVYLVRRLEPRHPELPSTKSTISAT